MLLFSFLSRWEFLEIGFFLTLGLSRPLLRALEDLKFSMMTPIQAASIPLLLAGKDLVGRRERENRRICDSYRTENSGGIC